MKNKTIKEIDVIIAVSLWLHSHGYSIQTISVPAGKGINKKHDEEKLKKSLDEKNVLLNELRFEKDGPDIIANCNDHVLKIECKGLGVGQDSTLRNNFDRALSSTVSYFNSKELFLGLALPNERVYCNLVSSRIPQVLRQALNLWIFYLDIDTSSIKVIKPDESIPAVNSKETIYL